MVLVENWPLLIFLFSGNKGQKNVFYDIIERKSALLGYKKEDVHKVEKLPFFQRSMVHGPWFWFKIGHFCTFFIQAIWAREMCFMIFYNENTPF